MTLTLKLEIRSVVKFAKILETFQCKLYQTLEKTGKKCSKELVLKLHRRFKEGWTSTEDNEHQGRPAVHESLLDSIKSVEIVIDD
ncbi:hypothetical protein ACF0H5_007712 [Mactra antiquata]